MRSYALDFSKSFFDDVVRLSELNDMDISDFMTLILNHHFYRGSDIAYLKDEQLSILHLPKDKKNPLKIVK